MDFTHICHNVEEEYLMSDYREERKVPLNCQACGCYIGQDTTSVAICDRCGAKNFNDGSCEYGGDAQDNIERYDAYNRRNDPDYPY